ncbi:MAG TPA: DUF4147 domain-containing protein [Longimicrobiales bacterium]|nr:DUF4147 domain-containing protein [Longimicrobiales bacterium]
MTELHAHADAILRAAIAAADPQPLVTRALAHAPEIAAARRVRLIAIGKASVRMARAAHDALGSRIVAAVVVAPHGSHDALPMMHAAHPVPDESSVRAAESVERTLTAATADDLVLVLLSGGASALTAAPAAGISILQYADCVRQLMRRGADIRALNIVRQHIDRLKGGRMAALAAPAPVLGLVLSDVVGDPLDIIASGPLSPPATTSADAARVLHAYGVSAPVTLLPDAPAAFDHVRVEIIGNNALAVAGAANQARALGYAVELLAAPVTGEAREAGEQFARAALERTARAPLCLLGGGETTVTVTGSGIGGRNQELVLAAALALHGEPGIVIGSIGTDGIDGPTDAAGAIADAAIAGDAARALAANDSYAFFRAHGGLIITGATGTNVMDVQVALIWNAD